MSSEQAEIDNLIIVLENAFRDTGPGSMTLHEAEVIDSYGTNRQRISARALDREREWQTIPDCHLEECGNALSHFDPESWRFHLPAFIRYGLRHFEQAAHSMIDKSIYTLAPGDDRSLAEYSIRRYKTLTPKQVSAICRFLEFASRNSDSCDAVVAEQALARYWRRAAD